MQQFSPVIRLDFNIDADLTVEMSLLLKGQATLLEADDFML